MQLDDTSLASLLAAAEQAGKPLSELVLASQAEQLEQTPEQVYDRMARCYQVMADRPWRPLRVSPRHRTISGRT